MTNERLELSRFPTGIQPSKPGVAGSKKLSHKYGSRLNIGRIAVALDGMDLTHAQWAVLEPTFRPRRRPDGRGRP